LGPRPIAFRDIGGSLGCEFAMLGTHLRLQQGSVADTSPERPRNERYRAWESKEPEPPRTFRKGDVSASVDRQGGYSYLFSTAVAFLTKFGSSEKIVGGFGLW
jgi:hypothetical protein